jgi:predicted ferric reductase
MIPDGYKLAFSRLLRIVLYILAAFSAIIVAHLFLPPSLNKFHYELGKKLALVGIMLVSLQVILAARFKWVSRPFGFDKLVKFHKVTAVAAAIILISHPLMLAWGRNDWSLLYGLHKSGYIWLGRSVLVLTIFQVLLSLLRDRIGLKFQLWRRMHNLGILIIVLAYIHSFLAGQDLKFAAMRILWATALAIVISVYIYHKWLGPLYRNRHPFRVRDVILEAHNVWTLEFEPVGQKKEFEYIPGQFAFIDLKRGENLPREEHHFTISSSPTQKGFLSSTIKASGDFTATIGQTKRGDPVSIQGAYGRFSHLLNEDSAEFIFLAAGIGITPLMSMLRHMRDNRPGKKVLLLYGNRTEADIVFRKELDSMEKLGTPRLRVIHTLTCPDAAWQGERGRIDKRLIEKYAGPYRGNRSYYICGPPSMTESMRRILKDMRVPGKYVHYERFLL